MISTNSDDLAPTAALAEKVWRGSFSPPPAKRERDAANGFNAEAAVDSADDFVPLRAMLTSYTDTIQYRQPFLNASVNFNVYLQSS